VQPRVSTTGPGVCAGKAAFPRGPPTNPAGRSPEPRVRGETGNDNTVERSILCHKRVPWRARGTMISESAMRPPLPLSSSSSCQLLKMRGSRPSNNLSQAIR
jgi:hypothetical protein